MQIFRALYETPAAFDLEVSADARSRSAALIAQARARGRTLLTEAESKSLLAGYGIPTVSTEVAFSANEAVQAASRAGYPVVLKLHSETLTHKTDVGGVQLNLADEHAVRAAYHAIADSVRKVARESDFLGVTVQPMMRAEGYELILGSTIDSQFGPVILFGSGGQLVEVYQDRAVGLPPLTTTLARRLMERTKILTALRGVRGRKPVDLEALEKLIVRFSYLITEQNWIQEIDINPLLASSAGLLALDARVVLHPAEVTAPPRSAIRPYPTQYVEPWKFPDGAEVLIRPIRPEDEPLIARFHDASVRAQRLSALFSPAGSGPPRLARPAHPHLLQRLRSRHRPGRRSLQQRNRRARNPGRRAPAPHRRLGRGVGRPHHR